MLDFKNLSIKYDKQILQDISGKILPSTITFLIGPNGCGKTSLLKALAKIIPTQSGEIATQESPIYFSSQWSPQGDLCGQDLFEIFDISNSCWAKNSLFDFFEINSLLKTKLNCLSSGERQRILLCAVLSHRSSLVLLDEPLSFLDWNFSLKLQRVLKEMKMLGRSFLIANHDLNWALQFKNTQTWVLFKKEISMQGSTEQILNDIKLGEIFKIKTELLNQSGKDFVSISL